MNKYKKCNEHPGTWIRAITALWYTTPPYINLIFYFLLLLFILTGQHNLSLFFFFLGNTRQMWRKLLWEGTWAKPRWSWEGWICTFTLFTCLMSILLTWAFVEGTRPNTCVMKGGLFIIHRWVQWHTCHLMKIKSAFPPFCRSYLCSQRNYEFSDRAKNKLLSVRPKKRNYWVFLLIHVLWNNLLLIWS